MKVILITGCSSGLGKALARTLHNYGDGGAAGRASSYRVFATSRNINDLSDLKRDGIDTVRLDVNNADEVKTVVDQIVREAGGIDMLICNAGVMRLGPILEQDISEVRAIFDTNLFGSLVCAHAVAPVMIRQRSGIIAVTGSMSVNVTAPYIAAYSASKAALHSIFEGIRLELLPYNVHVSVIEGGLFRSSLIQKSTFDLSKFTRPDSLWSRASNGMAAFAKFLETGSTSTAEQVAIIVAKKLCQTKQPPALILAGDQIWMTRLSGLIYKYISPTAIHKNLATRFGLNQKW